MSTTHPTNETTEWDDLQRKFGNLPPLPKEVKEEEIYLQTIDKLESENVIEKKSLKELEVLEDDCVDEEYLKIIEKYKNDRINETRKNQALEIFGDVYEISKDTFVTHVNETSKYNPLEKLEEQEENENKRREERGNDNKKIKSKKGTYVVVHMYSENVIACKVINNILNELAKKHKYIKFTKGVYNKIIENYPESKLPTILIYYNGVCIHQICNLLMHIRGGVSSLNVKTFEQFLKKYDIFKIKEEATGKLSDDSDDNSDDENKKPRTKSKKQYTGFNMYSRPKNDNDSNESSESDDSSDQRHKNSKTYASSFLDKQMKYY